MSLYISREYITEQIKEKAFGNSNIKINEDTMLRGVRVAKSLRIENSTLMFKMGSNEYSILDKEFTKVLSEILDGAHGVLESDDSNTYIEYIMS